MEPPAKRLRILSSAEVDETDPDYIKAKQQQQQKFKGRLESIFEKYGNMHESMSDEIDMRENKIVVDRGHLRRVVRQVNRRETVLLDTLGLAAGESVGDAESGEEEGDSEDELAPTQHTKLSGGGKPLEKDPATPSTAMSKPAQPMQTPTSQAMVAAQPSLSNTTPTANPAAALMQFVQFPQTPAGQQAQSSFCAAIAQTINQAVQQAVILTSAILQGTPNVPQSAPNAIPAAAVPIVNVDRVAPATDPKWFFPALTAQSTAIEAPPSSPLSQAVVSRTQTTAHRPNTYEQMSMESRAAELGEQNMSEEADRPLPPISPIVLSTTVLASEGFKKRIRQTSPRVMQVRRRGRPTKYNFTAEDDVYISRNKAIHNHTLSEIKNSREKWSTMSMSTFQNYWHNNLKGKNLHLHATDGETYMQEEDNLAAVDATKQSHHLPTPSSSGHEDGAVESNPYVAPVADISFNDDDCDLLSIGGSVIGGSPLPVAVEDDEDQDFDPDENDIILPSIEMADFVGEDTLQQGLLEDSPSDDMLTRDTTQEAIHIKTEKASSPPTNETYLTICDATTNTAVEETTITQTNPQRSPSLDLIAIDPLQSAPVIPKTPLIKRQRSTPPASGLLYRTPQQSHQELPSSGIKSASALSHKAFIKRVKQSWTKKVSPATKSTAKRRSLNVLPRKRPFDAVDVDSEDELGM